MTPLEQLTAARALIARPEAWTQGTFARNADGCGVSVRDDTACCWCALGALMTVSAADTYDEATQLLDVVSQAWGTCVMLNDRTDHPSVLAMYDRAIAMAGVPA